MKKYFTILITLCLLLGSRRKDVSVVTVKKLCDGLGISIPEFLNAPVFENPEQGIL